MKIVENLKGKADGHLLWLGYNLGRFEAIVISAISGRKNTFDEDLSRRHVIRTYGIQSPEIKQGED